VRGGKVTVAALYVETCGVYCGVPGVDAWDRSRDARRYAGPDPIIAHPPCGQWGRYRSSHPILGPNYRRGEADDCFAAAVDAVRRFGGVIEHPAHSKAWGAHGLAKPNCHGGWSDLDFWGGCSAYVEQGHYGHFSRKPTWLYVVSLAAPPELIWGPAPQRLPEYAISRYGYAKARRIGVVAAVGGKHKTRIREATPPRFRDLLIRIAEGARLQPPEPERLLL
jgi:hypothetical protein